MKTSRRFLVVARAVAVLAVVAAPAGFAAESQLQWTPHRAASQGTSEDPAAPQRIEPVAGRSAAMQAPAASPAAVVLPDEVPKQVARAPQNRQPARRPVAAAPSSDWSSPNRIAGPMQRVFDTSDPNRVFGMTMRTPKGDASRPILAPEGQQAVAMQQRAEALQLTSAGNERLGGGIAPRYSATPGARPRIDRIAMNADGLPSVMTEASQSSPAMADAPSAADVAPETIATPPSSDGDAPISMDGFDPGVEGMDPSMGMDGMPMGDGSMMDDGSMMGDAGLLMGDYPAQLHVESFFDDPYACEDDDPLCHHSGRFCAWLRRFGKPYYGWRWYRDFTASAGVTAFTNDTNLGIHGNYGTNEYLNWAMPFWNAFGVGWQIGWRGTQTNFQPAQIQVGDSIFRKNARDQNFVTTGFFTRAFEGHGLQGGAVYDYLSDSWLDNADIAQVRAEISYVWGYHEIGFWGAANITDQIGSLGRRSRISGTASTVDLYTGFYRLQFGDANEWKVWGGGTGDGEGIIGSILRAPLARSLAMEGTFTYLIPGQTRTIDITGTGVTTSFAPAAWNLGVNLVYYPAGRSRRGLASPYRPLFEVADNGSMIREFSATRRP